MRKEKLIVGLLAGTMLFVIVGVGFKIWQATQSNTQEKQSVKSSTTVAPITESSLNVTQNNGIGGGLAGGGDSTGSAGAASKAPDQKKEDYTQYDKYKDGKSALFGEIKAGTGAEAKSGSKVSIYYVGRLTDGSIFDQSRPEKAGEQPKPLAFELGTSQIITGLQQGLAGMKAGGTRRIVVPPSVGYGEKGQDSIPANAVMIFDVQLLTVE